MKINQVLYIISNFMYTIMWNKTFFIIVKLLFHKGISENDSF